jgi:hypothetical protein
MQGRIMVRQGVLVTAGLAWVFSFPALAGAAAPAPAPAGTVTAAVGSTASGGAPVGQQASLGDGSSLETGDDGGCAVLVDQDAVMQLCNNTALHLEHKDGKAEGPRVVKLDRGNIRMVVEPRVGEERIEIHTPAAIATILGTVLFVSVDALGVTTITTEAHRVLVQSSDANVKGSTVVESGQQLVIAPGEAPPKQTTAVSQDQIASLGGCLVDLHAASLKGASGSYEKGAVEAVVAQDLVDELPPVGAGGELAGPTLDNVNNDLADQTVVDPVDTVGKMIEEEQIPPPCPPGLPGETCGF